MVEKRLFQSESHDRGSCPCSQVQTIQDVANAVIVGKTPPVDLSTFLQWISQTVRPAAESQKGRHYCATPCPNRGRISLAILNSIRDACQIFLEDGTDTVVASVEAAAKKANSAARSRPETYEDSFPTLGGAQQGKRQDPKKGLPSHRPNNNNQRPSQSSKPQPKNKPGQKQGGKPKRRIRPATIQTTPLSTGKNNSAPPVWGQPQTSIPLESHQPSPAPPPEASQLLEHRLQNKDLSSTPSSINTQAVTRVSETILVAEESTPIQPSQSHPTVTTDISTLPSLENLVIVYHALIEASLVPSTALEIHLLLRFLTVPQKLNRKDKDGEEVGGGVFGELFENSDRCILFAEQVLSRLAHILDGLGLTRVLLKCPPVRLHGVKLVDNLQALEQGRVAAGLNNSFRDTGTPTKSQPTHHQTALFTLPFDQTRDSRHNFRSANDQAVYKNRETTRDAFLHQLRDFYNNDKNNLLSQQGRKYTPSQMKQIVRAILDSVLIENMRWFAEFFRDLLLQLGPVPVVQETDQELLQMADSDTLQKLHQRLFAATPTNSQNKPSKKSSQAFLVKEGIHANGGAQRGGGGGSRGANQSDSGNIQEEQRLAFTGYQEFFFLFVNSADSFHFGRHLFASLAEKLKELLRTMSSSSLQENDVDQLLPKMSLLSKFIGVLLFSPYWSTASVAPGSSALISFHDPLELLGISDILITDVLRRALSEHRLILAVPWVVDLLKMARWDPLINAFPEKTTTYKQILTELRLLQLRLKDERLASSSLAYLSTCLESLFDETVGVVRADSFLGSMESRISFEQNKPGVHVGFDQSEGIVPRKMMQSADAHVEELVELIAMVSRPSPRSKNPSRKLRPIQLPDQHAKISQVSMPSIQEASQILQVEDSNETAKSAAEAKLRDIFFHQHGELKEICDFTVGQVLKTLEMLLESECTNSIVEKWDINDDTNSLQAKLLSACQSYVRKMTEDQLKKALEIFAPPGCQVHVKEMAWSLYTTQGCKAAKPIILATVTKELDRIVATQKRELKVKATTAKSEIQDSLPDNHDPLAHVIVQLKTLTQGIVDSDNESVVKQARELTNSLNRYKQGEDSKLPPALLLRSLYQGILDLDSQLGRSLVVWIVTGDPKYWHVFAALVSLSAAISHISRHGLKSVVRCFAEREHFLRLIELADTAEESDSFIEVLFQLVEHRLITLRVITENSPNPELTQKLIVLAKGQAPEVDWEKLRSTGPT